MAVDNRALPGIAMPGSHLAQQAGLTAWLRKHWMVLAVLAAFALAAMIVPTLTPVAISDDWTYARSVQILLAEGQLTIFPVVVATAAFQIVWGALFGFLFGPTLGVFRLSTVVITALGGLALYGLCRELGVSRPRSAFGVAVLLFNPLVFVLAFTFMTDPHFVALLSIATWLFARALIPDRSTKPGKGSATSVDGLWTLAGSVAAALAFLTRHQGVLIVVAVVSSLLLSRRLRIDRASLALLARVTAIPLLTIVVYLLWLRSGGNTGAMQAAFLQQVISRGSEGTWWLVRWLTVFEVMYVGFFTLPLFAAALPFLGVPARRIGRKGWLFFGIWAAIAIVGVAVLQARGDLMPYVPQFFGETGLGPPDLLGGRPIILDYGERLALTAVCLLATLAFALIVARAMGAPASVERSRAALVATIGLWQAAGVFPPSYHFLGWAAGSVDRYLEPLAPLAIALALWGMRELPISLAAGWVVAGLLALFAIAGTRDYLVFMGAIWSEADQAVAVGVPLDRLDAGASWDGYHLYEYGWERHMRARTPKGGPWWVYLFGQATDSAYVVAGAPLPGHDVITEGPYSSWLDETPPTLYLLRRQGEPWPP
jgi:4-amino-4-deoxy-L-arabinose transferase-like glycosyltransferase